MPFPLGWLFCYCYLLTLSLVTSKEELLLVQTVFRHGDRSPTTTPPHLEGIPQADQLYFRGPGQLTNRGFSSARAFGTQLRQRYVDGGWLDERMMPSQLSFVSSQSARCVQTAQAAAAEMFSSHKVTLPVFSREANRDYMLYQPRACPLLVSQQAAYAAQKDFDPTNTRLLSKVVRRQIGTSAKFTNDEYAEFFEAFLVYQLDGIPLPSWYNESYRQQSPLLYYDLLCRYVGCGAHHNADWLRMSCGELIGELLSNANDFNSNTTIKFRGYGTHDSMLLCLSDSFGVLEAAFGKQPPGYVSSVTMELWETNEGKKVKLFASRNASAPFLSLPIPACSGDCSLQRFTALFSQASLEDEKKLCYGGEMARYLAPGETDCVTNTSWAASLTLGYALFSLLHLILF